MHTLFPDHRCDHAHSVLQRNDIGGPANIRAMFLRRNITG